MEFLPHRQHRGFATLTVALILLLISTFLIFAVSKAVFYDQKGVGDEIRIKEAYEAAKSGLEYGLRELQSNDLNAWTAPTGGTPNSVGATTTPLVAASDITMGGSGNIYSVSVSYERMTELPDDEGRHKPIIKVMSTASPAGGDSHVQRTVSTLALRADIFGTALGGSGPILVEGSLLDTKGTAEVVPGPNGIGVASLDDGATLDVDSVDMHGAITVLADTDITLSEAMFGVEEHMLDSHIQRLANTPELEGKVIYVNDPSFQMGSYPATFTSYEQIQEGHANYIDVTDVANQHVIYFSEAAGCPKLNGNPNIVGLVYIAKAGCDYNGWGGCNIFGTVAMSGSSNDLNANCQFIGMDLSGLGSFINDKAAVVSPIPGTWNDY